MVSLSAKGILTCMKLDVVSFLADTRPMYLMDCFKNILYRYILLTTWGLKVIETILLLALKALKRKFSV